MINTKVNICGVEFKNPVITSSGTFGFGFEFNQFYDISELGGISVKGLTLKPREGNAPPRIAETEKGIINSVGLQNPGVEAFISDILPLLRKKDLRIIANIAGNTIDEYCEMAKILSESDVDMIEMNISCPNVKQGGAAFGTDTAIVYEITNSVKKVCKKPLIVKLSPNVTSITDIAIQAQRGGADCISLINTMLGMKIDINSRRPILRSNVGGLSGPCVKPIGVRMVWQVRGALGSDFPIIGMGGISGGDDALEYMIAGADIISVGTQNLVDPYAALKIKYDIEKYMKEKNIENINDIVGTVATY